MPFQQISIIRSYLKGYAILRETIFRADKILNIEYIKYTSYLFPLICIFYK